MQHILLVREWRTAPYAGIELIEQFEGDIPGVYRSHTYKTNKRHHETKINGVRLYSQCNLDDAPDQRKLYAFRVTMGGNDIHWLNMEEAEHDIARLKKIRRGYNALVEKFGEPKGFVQFVTFVADVLGAKLARYRDGCVQEMSLYRLEQLEKEVLGIE